MSETPSGALDEAQLERLYAKLEKPIYNVVYRWLWSREEARDLTQEAFLRLWKMRDRVDLATVEPLVYRIAINLASNRRRARKLWSWISLSSSEEAAGEAGELQDPADISLSVLDRERAAYVRRAIDELPEGLKRVIMLAEFSELSYQEIATVLSIPMGTVGSRRHKALAKLRAALEPFVKGDPHVA